MTQQTNTHRIVVPIRLNQHHQRWVYACFGLLWLSGALWLLFHYFLQTPSAFGPHPHVLEPWWLRLHGLTMMATLVLVGTTLVHHAHKAWRLGRNRAMGALLTACLVWLAASGYALYYFASDSNEAWLPLLHWIPGLSLPAIIAVHVLAGRAKQTSRKLTGTTLAKQTQYSTDLIVNNCDGQLRPIKITPAQTANSSPRSARSHS
ncbi:MAG: hypothetical protein HZB57_09185 [Gammaproteobacteria bacterium]|nr:hypothetical protein [Gammaproteobacteria bacterium]